MARNRLSKLSRQAATILRFSAIARSFKSGPAVLFYHGVEEDLVDPEVQTLHLPMARFENHIAYLRKHFEIVSLDYLFDKLSNHRRLDPRQIAITFDDGYRNNLEVVAPFLNGYNVPFSVFVSTRHVSEGLRFPTYYLRAGIHYCRDKYIRILDKNYDISSDEKKREVVAAISERMKATNQDSVLRIVADLVGLLSRDRWIEIDERFSSDQPMNWVEVRELSNLGATIGSHCHDHMLLHKKQDMKCISFQLQTSKELVEKHIGACKYIAYPNGSGNDISPDAVEQVKKCGYRAGFMTVPGEIRPHANRYVLPRIAASGEAIHHFRLDIDASSRYNRRYDRWCKTHGFS